MIIGADSHTCTYGALGAFSTGVGSTDMAAGMATGKAWFKVPSAIKFNIVGKPAEWISGKDVILHIIGMIGVDGCTFISQLEFAEMDLNIFLWTTDLLSPIWQSRPAARMVSSL